MSTCPACGKDRAHYRYPGLMSWMGCVMYVGVLGLTLVIGVLIGVMRNDWSMGDLSFTDGFQAWELFFVLLIVLPLVVWGWLRRYWVCDVCGHQWVR